LKNPLNTAVGIITMAKISEFDQLSSLTGNEDIPVAKDGKNFRIAVSALLELYGPDFKGILTDPANLPAVADSKRGWIYQIDGHLWMLGEDADNPGTNKWQDMGDFKGANGTDGANGAAGMLPDYDIDGGTPNITITDFRTEFNAQLAAEKPTAVLAKRFLVEKDPENDPGTYVMGGFTTFPTPLGRYFWAYGPGILSNEPTSASVTMYIPDGGTANVLTVNLLEKGEKGADGEKGEDGAAGKDGTNGKDGKNAVGMQVVGLLEEGQEADLPDPADFEVGDTYIVGKHFWMKIGVEWVDIGDFTGPDGASAYKVAVLNGFVGTETDWLKSLKGADGIGLRIIGSLATPDLLPEQAEASGDSYIIQEKMYVWDGTQWSTVGQVGPEGKAGEGIYQMAVRLGYKGTEAEFIESQRGPRGLQGIQGVPGDPGKDGKDGKDGSNASSVNFKGGVATESALPSTGNTASDAWMVEDVSHLFIWTGLAWYDTGVFSAKGEQGEKGDPGTNGKDGEKGDEGPEGPSAYDVAVKGGFNGTETQWLLSLIGKGLVAKGTVATFEDLANVANPVQGWAYNVIGGDKIGHQYVYDGTQFVDMGDIRGQRGEQGIQGLKGDPGPSLIPKGSVADSADLLNITDAVVGWLYNVTGGDDEGHQFIWNGADWIDMGNIRGGEGKQGIQGEEGPAGKNAGGINFKGIVTEQSQLPTAGNVNADAYFVVQNLFVWNDTQWVDCGSFKGLKGDQGEQGIQGEPGENGKDGNDGAAGKSTYQIALDHGYVGTEAQWLMTQVGAPVQAKGEVADIDALNAVADPKQGWLYNVTATGHMYIYNAAWVDMGLVRGIQGIQGIQGEQGNPGADGKDGADGTNGDNGKSIVGKGRVETEEELPATPEFGWAYFVGTNLRIYDGTEWVDFGDFEGPEGPQGIQGEMGAGIKILGKKDSQGDLPTTGTIGDGYMIGSDFWVWDGDEYVDVGPIKGPKGDQGLRGLQGLKGEKGDPGDKGEKGDQGTLLIILDRDPGPLDGRINDYFMSTIDQKLYRKTSDTAWAYMGTFGGGNVYDAPHDDKKYVYLNGAWVQLWVPDAPSLTDNNRYFLKNGAWDIFNAYDVKTMTVTDGVCDFTKAQWFLIDGTKAASITFPNLPLAATNRGTTLIVTFTGKGGNLSWPSAIKWSGGSIPTFGDTLTILVFTWDGTHLTGSLSQSY
jgi:hypothetical protein